MTLLLTVFAAIITTVKWYNRENDNMKLHVLMYMFWGASLMWFVDAIAEYIMEHFEGNSLIAAGDEDMVKIHFHTNEPWKILEYCNTVGEIYDIIIEDMIRQSDGLPG